MPVIFIFLTILGISYSSLLFLPGQYYVNDSNIDEYEGLLLIITSNVQIYCQEIGGCTNAATEMVQSNALRTEVHCGEDGFPGCSGVSLYVSTNDEFAVDGFMQNITFRSSNLNYPLKGEYKISSGQEWGLLDAYVLSSNDDVQIDCLANYSCQGLTTEDMISSSQTNNEFMMTCHGYQSCSGDYDQSNFDSFDIYCLNQTSCDSMNIYCSDDYTNNNKCGLTCDTAVACSNVTIYAERGINAGVTLSGGSDIANLEDVKVYCGSSYTTLCTLDTNGGCVEGTVTCS